MNILLLEDDLHLRIALVPFLQREGWTVFEADCLATAWEIVDTNTIDGAIVDWILPDGEGIHFCADIRGIQSCKTLMLTAKTTNDDEWQSLAVADDYLRKPFDPRIVVARLKKLLGTEQQLTFADLALNVKTQVVTKAGVTLSLTRREYDLLLYFMRHCEQIIAREQLLVHVWGFDFDGDDRTVDTHIKRLREKIGQHIHTHRGLGYRFGDAHA